MKIIACGIGYVGPEHAAVCSEYGHRVYARDNGTSTIEAFSSGYQHMIETYSKRPGTANPQRRRSCIPPCLIFDGRPMIPDYEKLVARE